MKKLLLILVLIPFFHGVCYAEDASSLTAEITEIEQVEDGLLEEERVILGDLRLDGTYDGRGALSRLAERIGELAAQQIRSELSFVLKLIFIAVVSAVATLFSQDKRITETVEIASCCSAVLLLAGDVRSVIGQATEAIYRLSDYGKAAFPAFFSAAAVCGSPASASVKYASVCFASNLLMDLSQRLVLPLIDAYLALTVSSSLFDNRLLSAAGRFAKWSVVTSMTLLTGAFCTYISLCGVIAGSADAAAVKVAKSVISSTFPVVGGILSDSASAVLSAAVMIRYSAGIFCLLAVCVLCAGPFVLLTVKMLLLKGASVISEISCESRFPRLLGDLGTVFGMLLGLIGSFGVMLFFTFMSGIRMTAA